MWGWIGARDVDILANRSRGHWVVDGRRHPELDGCEDLDFGFTPASNLASVRRLKLRRGQRAEFSVAWLNVEAGEVKALPQIYERRSARLYAYASPSLGYRATLEVDDAGFVRRYGRLWREEK